MPTKLLGTSGLTRCEYCARDDNVADNVLDAAALIVQLVGRFDVVLEFSRVRVRWVSHN